MSEFFGSSLAEAPKPRKVLHSVQDKQRNKAGFETQGSSAEASFPVIVNIVVCSARRT